MTWTLYPDGRYFMDEDGYGMEDNNESVLYGSLWVHRSPCQCSIPFSGIVMERI